MASDDEGILWRPSYMLDEILEDLEYFGRDYSDVIDAGAIAIPEEPESVALLLQDDALTHAAIAQRGPYVATRKRRLSFRQLSAIGPILQVRDSLVGLFRHGDRHVPPHYLRGSAAVGTVGDGDGSCNAMNLPTDRLPALAVAQDDRGQTERPARAYDEVRESLPRRPPRAVATGSSWCRRRIGPTGACRGGTRQRLTQRGRGADGRNARPAHRHASRVRAAGRVF